MEYAFGGSLASLTIIAIGVLACITAAVVDVRTRRVPNWLTFTVLAAALAVSASRGFASFGATVLVVAAALALGVVIHMAGLLGGGDVKLLVGISALVGFPNCVALLLYTALAGGVVALISAASHGHLVAVCKRAGRVLTFAWISRSLAVTQALAAAPSFERIPYALAIGAGFAALVLSKTYLPALRIPL